MSMLEARFARFETWMRDQALPFWSETGLAPDGGAVERLTLAGQPDRPGFKRVRVHARQLYVFSHAHVLGVPGMLEAAREVHGFLMAHGRSEDGGWVVKMGEAGGCVDPERDLYDQAFVILALAWWARASGETAPITEARHTLAEIDELFARPDGRGYLSRLPDQGEALQNPHMHLLEALLALHAVDPEGPASARITRLRALFDEVLLDAETGTLGERFDMNWAPRPDDAIEPGHHYEWFWLLHMAERAGFGTAEPAATRLWDFAERHGVLPGSALIHDGLDRSGARLSAAHRSWPQTERLKALAVRAEISGRPETEAAISAALEALWRHYIAPATPGGWVDHIGADLQPKVEYVPASTLYHLFLAYAELRRCATALGLTAHEEGLPA